MTATYSYFMTSSTIGLGLAILGSLAVAFLLTRSEPDSGDWWLPIVASVIAFILFFIVTLCGFIKEKNEPAWLLAMGLMPLEFYLIRSFQYCRLCTTRRNDLKAQLTQIGSLPGGARRPFSFFWSALTDDSYSEAKRCIKKLGQLKAVELFESLVIEHKDTLERKRGQSSYFDEYNRLQDGGWRKHAAYFIQHVAAPIIKDSNLPSPYIGMEWMPVLNKIITEQQPISTRGALEIDDVETGVEYEFFIADMLRDDGWDIQMTPGSGDQGADVIATKSKFRVAIQCKLWSSTVGNASVQEVYTAKGFYKCDAGLVVSNAVYSRSARLAATSLSIPLVHHNYILSVMNNMLPESSLQQIGFGPAS